MSRIGKKPIPIPKGVTVQIGADTIDVKGPKGAIRTPFPPGITFVVDDGQILAKTVRDERALGKFHGLAGASWPTPSRVSPRASRRSSTSPASATVRR